MRRVQEQLATLSLAAMLPGGSSDLAALAQALEAEAERWHAWSPEQEAAWRAQWRRPWRRWPTIGPERLKL